MIWKFKPDMPIYTQIIEHIKFAIVSGEYEPGGKLLSVRELAAQAGVNPNTMQKALAELEQDNLVFTQSTAGRFITQDKEKIKAVKNQFAKEQIGLFLQMMQHLGFDKNQTLQILEGFKGEA